MTIESPSQAPNDFRNVADRRRKLEAGQVEGPIAERSTEGLETAALHPEEQAFVNRVAVAEVDRFRGLFFFVVFVVVVSASRNELVKDCQLRGRRVHEVQLQDGELL